MQPTYHDYRLASAPPAAGQLRADPRTGAILRVSPALCALLGYAEHELRGRPWLELAHPDERAAAWGQWASLAAGSLGELVSELRLLHRDGAPRWAQVTAVPLGDEGCPPDEVVVVVHDIGERKRAAGHTRFLAELSEALMPLPDAQAVRSLVASRLAAYLEVDSCALEAVDPAGGWPAVAAHLAGSARAPQAGAGALEQEPALLEALRAGLAVALEDTAADPHTRDHQLTLYGPAGVAALAVVPLLRAGRWAASLLARHGRPRRWHQDELGLLRSAGDLAWLAVERLGHLAELRRTSDSLALALSATRGFIYEYDPADGSVWRSEGFEQALGYAAGEVQPTAAWWRAQLHPDDYERVYSSAAGAAEADGHYSVEYRVRHKDGHYLTVWDRARVERDGAGQVVRVLGYTLDVSEHRAAEEEIRRANERLTLALSATDGFIYEYDPATRAVTRSEGLRQVTGYAVEEVPASGEWWNARVHPDDYQRAVTDGIAAFDTGFTSYSLEYRVLHRDGHYVDVWDRAIVQRDEAGQAARVFGHAIDVSERKRAERQLQERVDEIETLMETVPVAIWVAHDRACTRITGNSAGYRLLRTTPGGNLSHTAPRDERPTSFRIFQNGVELPGEELPMQRAARLGRPVDEVELDLLFDTGDVVTVFGFAAPLFDAEGGVRGCIGAYIDVTERRRAEEERIGLLAAERRAREQAQAAVQVRDSFLSIAAHELKTPLTVMRGNAQLLQRRAEADASYSERDRRAIRAVADQTVRLERMINALLDVSRIEAGQLRIIKAPFDLGALALRLVQEVRPTLRGHSIVYLGASPVPVNADELRMEQVLQNLLSNAVKYSPDGGSITVRATAGAGRAMVSVSDEGIGIPEADVPRLFSRFFRGASPAADQAGGIGIGLYVVKEIVTLHGGEVQVASRVGDGTTVTISLPLHGDGG